MAPQIEGRGNGIKTVVTNNYELSRALKRPTSYLTKFYGFELGAQTIINDDTQRYIVNGAHEASTLQTILFLYIKKFILCGSCGNPETVTSVKKGAIINSCKACGALSKVDMSHKLSNFIVNHPPDPADPFNTLGGAAGGKKTKKDKKSRGAKSKEGEEDDNEDGEEFDDDNDNDNEDEGVAAAEDPDEVGDEPGPEVALDTDTAKEKMGEALTALDGATRQLAQQWQQQSPQNEETFRQLWEAASASFQLARIEAVRCAFSVLITKTFLQGAFKIACPILKSLTGGDEDLQIQILYVVEDLIAMREPSLQKVSPAYFKVLYDSDVCEEDSYFKWAKSDHPWITRKEGKKMRKSTIPFLEWLESAEEESSDEED